MTGAVRGWALALAVAAAACGGKKASPQDECAAGRAEFLHGLRGAFDDRIAGSPGDPNIRPFFDKKYAQAEQAYLPYCKSVTAAEWACVKDTVERGGPPTDACRDAAKRFMHDVVGEDDPVF